MQTPLWLPAGSIRSIMALALVGVSVYLFGTNQPVPPELLTLDGAVMALYFMSRKDAAEVEVLAAPVSGDAV